MSQFTTVIDAKQSISADEIHYVDEPHEIPSLTVPKPSDVLLRLGEVLRMIPVSKSSWYAGMDDGIYPQSIKIGQRSVAWRLSDITLVIAGAWQARSSV